MNSVYSPLFTRGLLLVLLVIGLDQLSKGLLLEFYAHTPPPMKLTSFFNLVVVWNRGVSFGLLAEAEARWLLTGGTLVIVGLLLVWLWRCREALTTFALGLVIGGAIGNIIDRVRLGAVFDFLDFYLGTYHWPAFNVADSCIVVGVLLLLLSEIRAGNT